MIGSDPRSEMHTPIGRMDTVIITKDRIFLFEFKMEGTAEEAIHCIKERHYADSLRLRNKPVTGVGIVFSASKKGIFAWDWAEL
jgi:hypothetical protein